MPGIKTSMLDCGCARKFRPPVVVGDEVYCLLHERSATVTSDGWAWKCETCNRHGVHGSAKLTAEVKAAQHAIRQGRGHIVAILFEGKRQRTINVTQQTESAEPLF